MLFIRCFVRTEISCCNDCYFYDLLGTIEISVLMFAIYCDYELYFAVEKASDRNFVVRLWTGPDRFYFFSRILFKWFSSFKMYAFFSPCPRDNYNYLFGNNKLTTYFDLRAPFTNNQFTP